MKILVVTSLLVTTMLGFAPSNQHIGEGEIRLCKVHTDMNVSDPLTKTLSLAKHVQHREAMGVKLLL